MADPTPEQMARLNETPPRCPICGGGLPGIATQAQMATYLIVRCFSGHFWVKDALALAPEGPAVVAAYGRRLEEAKAADDAAPRRMEED